MSQMRPYVLGGAVGGLTLLGVLVLVGMATTPSARDVKAIHEQNVALKAKIESLENVIGQAKADEPRNGRPTANDGDDRAKRKGAWGYPDALAYYAPPIIVQVPFAAKHPYTECSREFASTSREAYDGVLFAEAGQKFHVASVAGSPQFHVHLLTEVENGGKVEIAKDEIAAANAQGIVELAVAGELPTRILVVMPPMTVEYPGASVLVPPYTVTARVLPASKMQAVLSAQEFVTAVAPARGETPDLFAAVTPRSDLEFVFGAYDASTKRRALGTNVYLCAAERYVLQPTFRLLVTNAADLATNKIEVLGFPPAVSWQAAGSDLFDLEEGGNVLAKLPVPERPRISLPNNEREPLPRVAISASFYGLRPGASYRLLTAVGKAGKAALAFEAKPEAFSGDHGPLLTEIQAEQRGDEVVPAAATYHLRLARAWNMTGGCARFRLVAAMPAGPVHQHEPFIAADKAIHFKVVRLGGLRQAANSASFAPILAGMLADGAMRAALGQPEYRGQGTGDGTGLSNSQGFDLKTNIYVGSGAGGGGSTGGSSSPSAGGWAPARPGPDILLLPNGTVTTGTSPWQEINRRLNEESMRQIQESGRGMPKLGWQSHFNAPRPEGSR